MLNVIKTYFILTHHLFSQNLFNQISNLLFINLNYLILILIVFKVKINNWILLFN